MMRLTRRGELVVGLLLAALIAISIVGAVWASDHLFGAAHL